MNSNKVVTFDLRWAVARSTIGFVLAAAVFGCTNKPAAVSDQPAATAAAMPAAPVAAIPAVAVADSSAPFVKESLQQMTATVEAISMATREVTLRGPAGNTRTIKVGPEAHNLDKVRVGDHVTVSYYESFTAQMRMHDKPNVGFMNAAGMVKAAPGEQPGGAAAQSTASTVTINSVDMKANTVTFHRPDGAVNTLPIKSPEGHEFVSKLKAGDVVDVMYTEAVAIDVAPAPAK